MMKFMKWLGVFLLSAIITIFLIYLYAVNFRNNKLAEVVENNALKSILGFQMIGMNLSYLEKQIGPAIRSENSIDTFNVNGCIFL